jgi:hypothetical protein
LHVDQLTSTDLVDLPSGSPGIDHPSVEVVGVTLAGQAATVDDKGVHVAGQTAGQTAQSLADQGLSIRLLGTSQQDGLGAARSAAAGLEVRVSVPVKGAPTLPGLPGLDRVYVSTVLFGGVGVAATASSSLGLDLTMPPLPATTPLTRHLTPSVVPRQVTPDLGVTQRAGETPSSGALAPLLAVPVAHVLSFDLTAVARALAIVPLAILVLWRLRVTWRRRT